MAFLEYSSYRTHDVGIFLSQGRGAASTNSAQAPR